MTLVAKGLWTLFDSIRLTKENIIVGRLSTVLLINSNQCDVSS